MLMRKVETLETNKSLASRPPKAYTFPAQLRADIPSPAVMTLLWLREAQPAPSVLFPFGARHIISHGDGTKYVFEPAWLLDPQPQKWRR